MIDHNLVNQMMEMGLTPRQAHDALTAANGNLAEAIEWFFSAQEKPVPHVAKPSSKRSEASAAVSQPWRSDAKPRSVVERLNGIVETVRPEGYGFIHIYEHNTSVFYHVNQILDRSRELEVGDEVEFQLEKSERSGKMCCARIKLIAGATSKSSSKRPAPSQLPSKSSKNGRVSPPSAVEPLAKLYQGTVTKVAPEWGYIKVDSLCGDSSAPVPKTKLFFNVADVKASRALEMNDAVIFQIGLSETAGESANQILLANSSEGQAELLKRSNRGKVESNNKMSDSVSALFTAAANSSKDAYFIRNMQISHDEDREHEFKSMQTARALDDAIASVAPKYINAFLNTAGGAIFFGVYDSGRVHGLTIDRSMRDSIRLRLDSILRKFTPSIYGDLYDLTFVPVLERPPPNINSIVSTNDLFVVKIRVSKGPALVYETGNKDAFIRLEGSVIHMPVDVLRDRATAEIRAGQEQAQRQQTKDMEAAIERRIRELLKKDLLVALNHNNSPPAAAKPEVVEIEDQMDVDSDNSSSKAEAAPVDVTTFKLDNVVIQQLSLMGFNVGSILEALYQLFQERLSVTDYNVILDRLQNPISAQQHELNVKLSASRPSNTAYITPTGDEPVSSSSHALPSQSTSAAKAPATSMLPVSAQPAYSYHESSMMAVSQPSRPDSSMASVPAPSSSRPLGPFSVFQQPSSAPFSAPANYGASSQSANAFESHADAMSDDAIMIPCELCQQAFDIGEFESHQRECIERVKQLQKQRAAADEELARRTFVPPAAVSKQPAPLPQPSASIKSSNPAAPASMNHVSLLSSIDYVPLQDFQRASAMSQSSKPAAPAVAAVSVHDDNDLVFAFGSRPASSNSEHVAAAVMGSSSSSGPIDEDFDGIPCEFCDSLFRFDQLSEHQTRCRQRK